MKTLLLVLALYAFGYASSVNLNQLLDNVQENHPSFKASQEAIQAQHFKHEAEFSTAPLSFISSVANATPAEGDDTIEYSLGVEKEFRIGKSAYYTSQMGHYEHEAMEGMAKKELLALQNELKKAYHLSCIEKENIANYAKLLEQFELIYSKKLKAFDYGELSKKELLQLSLEKDRLIEKITALIADEVASRRHVLALAQYESDNELACTDLLPLQPFLGSDQTRYPLSEEIYRNLNLSSDNALKRYESTFNTMSVALHYDNETDIERVGVDLSIPLTFTSTEYEKMRLSSLHNKQKLLYEKEALFLHKNALSAALTAQLNTLFEQYKSIYSRVQTYQKELLPLIETSYRLNESSLIEYLLSYTNFNTISEELNRTKKNYYNTLFQLYSVLEIKE